MAGKASLSVFSACCCAFNGRGGFGGATSSLDSEFVSCEEERGISWGSSSKSSSRAVVGDSGGFYFLSASCLGFSYVKWAYILI